MTPPSSRTVLFPWAPEPAPRVAVRSSGPCAEPLDLFDLEGAEVVHAADPCLDEKPAASTDEIGKAKTLHARTLIGRRLRGVGALLRPRAEGEPDRNEETEEDDRDDDPKQADAAHDP